MLFLLVFSFWCGLTQRVRVDKHSASHASFRGMASTMTQSGEMDCSELGLECIFEIDHQHARGTARSGRVTS